MRREAGAVEEAAASFVYQRDQEWPCATGLQCRLLDPVIILCSRRSASASEAKFSFGGDFFWAEDQPPERGRLKRTALKRTVLKRNVDPGLRQVADQRRNRRNDQIAVCVLHGIGCQSRSQLVQIIPCA